MFQFLTGSRFHFYCVVGFGELEPLARLVFERGMVVVGEGQAGCGFWS